MLRFRRRLILLLLLFVISFLRLGFRGRLLLGSFLLLGLFAFWFLGRLVLDRFVDVLQLAYYGGVDGLMVDGFVPACNVGVLSAPFLVKEVLEATGEDAGSVEVGEGNTLAYQEGVDEKVFVEHGNGLHGGFDGFGDVLLIVGVPANEGAETGGYSGEDFVVGEAHPAYDGGVVLLGFSEEGGLLVLGSDLDELAVKWRKAARREVWGAWLRV